MAEAGLSHGDSRLKVWHRRLVVLTFLVLISGAVFGRPRAGVSPSFEACGSAGLELLRKEGHLVNALVP